MSGLEFKSSPIASLGMEIELQLLDPETLDLVDGLLPLMERYPAHPHIQPEFNQATVEITSKVCSDIRELEADITSVLQTLNVRCQDLGMTLCAAGTHPFCNRLASVTPISRYLTQEKIAGGYLAQTLMTYALHVHVGMPSGDESIDIMTRLRPYLPILLALSASSPFWWGHNTGHASYRQRVLAAMRTYGIPPAFNTWKDFSDFFDMARHAQMFDIVRDIHWDLRPQPDLGTLEVRVMDVQPTIREAIMLAALVHTLVTYLQGYRAGKETGYLLSPCSWPIEKENYFRASRWGLDANYIEDDRGNSRPIRKIAEDILDTLTTVANNLRETEYLNLLKKRLQTGPSYIRQQKVFKKTGSLKAVTASLVRELEEELQHTQLQSLTLSL